MDPQNLADQRQRVLVSAVNAANAHIIPLTAAHQQSRSTSSRLRDTVRRKDSDARRAWRTIAEQNTEIRQLKDNISGLERTLEWERYHNDRLRNNEAIIQHQHSQTRAELHRREDEWTARLRRVKAVISNLLIELKGAAGALCRTDLTYRIGENVEYEALRALEEGSTSSAPIIYTSDPPGAVDMARQRGYMGHCYRPQEG